jgi:hypothetical protein
VPLIVLVVEVEQPVYGEDSSRALRAAMFEVRDRLQALDVPVRRAWAAAGDLAQTVAELHGGPE